MGMSINSKVSGFKKWAEIHEPANINQARTAVSSVSAAADDDQGAKTPDQQTHRPWLVPGTGKL